MLRGLSESLVLFLLPFAGYALMLVLRRRFPFVLAAWTEGPLGRLVVAGLALAIAGALLVGFFGNRLRGAYVPAHLENGVLVPGRME